MSERSSEEGRGREIYFEFVQIGAQVRVAAVDAATGTEVVVMAPANAMRMDMERLALRKLMRVLDGDQGDDPEPPKGPGWVV